jgi:hypothetical protein
MAADVVDLAALQHHDRIRGHQHGKPMRDADDGTVLGYAHEIGVDDRLALGVERAGRLVEDEDGGIDQQGASDRKALALATGKVGSPFLQHWICNCKIYVVICD